MSSVGSRDRRRPRSRASIRPLASANCVSPLISDDGSARTPVARRQGTDRASPSAADDALVRAVGFRDDDLAGREPAVASPGRTYAIRSPAGDHPRMRVVRVAHGPPTRGLHSAGAAGRDAIALAALSHSVLPSSRSSSPGRCKRERPHRSCEALAGCTSSADAKLVRSLPSGRIECRYEPRGHPAEDEDPRRVDARHLSRCAPRAAACAQTSGEGDGRRAGAACSVRQDKRYCAGSVSGASGGISRYCRSNPAISWKAGAATTPPQIDAAGSSTVTRITSRGFFAGTMPTNDAT